MTIEVLENNEKPTLSPKSVAVRENQCIVSKIQVQSGLAEVHLQFARSVPFEAGEQIYMYRDDDPSELRGLKSILSYPIPSNQKFWFAVSGQIDSKHIVEECAAQWY